MTKNEQIGAAILTGFAFVLLEPELMKVANTGLQVVNESLRKGNLGGLLAGGLVSAAAFSTVFYKHPRLLPRTR